jgi:hypothetical protein
MPDPSFANFNYLGNSVVMYDNAYHWQFIDPQGNTFQLWDRQSDREIIRIDFVTPSGFREEWYECDCIGESMVLL